MFRLLSVNRTTVSVAIMYDTPDNRIPLTRIQRLIGRLMLESKQRCPACYLQVEADLTELTALRKPLSKDCGVRITTNDFFFCALARAIPEFPLMAARLDEAGHAIEISAHVGIGFAVAAPQGLVVPVIQDAAGKDLVQLSRESDVLLKKARSNRLVPDDLCGENVVLSGLGMYGVRSFYAIAPPCASAILSLGNLHEMVHADGEGFVVRKKMWVGLAANRRLMHEVYAARFLRRLVDLLENPVQLTRL